MSEIKSFLDWSKNYELEYKKRLEKAFFDLCEDEIKMVGSIIDVALEYQDDGAEFKFLIFIGKVEKPDKWFNIVYSINIHESLRLIFDANGHPNKTPERLIKKCLDGDGSPFIVIECDHTDKDSIKDFYQRIKSLFPDWKCEIGLLSEPGHFNLTIYKI